MLPEMLFFNFQRLFRTKMLECPCFIMKLSIIKRKTDDFYLPQAANFTKWQQVATIQKLLTVLAKALSKLFPSIFFLFSQISKSTKWF